MKNYGGIDSCEIMGIINNKRVYMLKQIKKCKHCECELNEYNAARNGRKGAHFRNECKPCRSKLVIKQRQIYGDRLRTYANDYARRIGRVKEYPCIKCGIPCTKKYEYAFCSDKCRFWNYVKTEDLCWIWIGGKNRSGYGKFTMKGYKNIAAHRASYIIFKGEIPLDLFVCHTCDNPTCVKPDHLWLGTNSDNQQDGIKKGRHRWQKIKELNDKTL